MVRNNKVDNDKVARVMGVADDTFVVVMAKKGFVVFVGGLLLQYHFYVESS